MDLRVIVRAPGEPPAEYELGEHPMVLGRDASCDIPIPSQYVSRRHCQIEPTADGFDIVDLGGRNPVFVNGEAISGRRTLRGGDTVTIADVSIDITGGDAVSTGTVVFTPQTAAANPLNARRPPSTPGQGIQGLWSSQQLAPGATVTIMFTDLERSTSMVTNLGEREAYRVTSLHNQILREQFETYRGIEAKRMGDGFLVLFASARDALNAAIAIQRKLLATAAEPHGPIRVRIGIHIGEVLWDENDIFGASVNFAARVMSEAQAGEILISALLREVIAPSGEFTFGEERIVPLKGFRGLHKLTTLEWAT
jgi:class 3 adenylate cyclase